MEISESGLEFFVKFSETFATTQIKRNMSKKFSKNIQMFAQKFRNSENFLLFEFKWLEQVKVNLFYDFTSFETKTYED